MKAINSSFSFALQKRAFGSQIVHGKKLQVGALRGARRLAKAVGATLGPGGRTVVIDPFQAANFNQFSVYPKPIITKDGVTVARNVDVLGNDKMQSIGAKLLMDAAEQANELSGDGTTSCTVIAESILEEGRMLMNTTNLKDFRTGVQDAIKVLSDELDKLA